MLQEHAHWNEHHRRLHEGTIEALEQTGLFRLRVPKRYGGYESDIRTLVEVLAKIGEGDGSTAWVSWVLTGNTWLVGLFSDVVQEEVFANPNVRVSGTLSPTGRVESRDGGFVLNGEWHFHSGAWHSQWSALAAMSITPEGDPAPITHVQVAEAAMKIDEAEFHAYRAADLVDSKAASAVARPTYAAHLCQ